MYHDTTFVNAETDYRRSLMTGDSSGARKWVPSRPARPRTVRPPRIRWRRAYGH